MIIDPDEVDLVIYHADCSDGFTAAFSAWKRLGDRAEYQSAQHGHSKPDVTGKNVAILDFCYDRHTIDDMLDKCRGMIILDHHKSAIACVHDLPHARLDMEHSGAFLAWQFFNPSIPTPRIVLNVEDRDLWKWRIKDSSEFLSYLDMVPFDFKEFDKYITDESRLFDEGIRSGTSIKKYVGYISEKKAKKASLRDFMGYRSGVCNASDHMSDIAMKILDVIECDISLVWFYNAHDREIKISLRSKTVDVSRIAELFGGGGHKSAAGFQIKGTDIEGIFSSTAYGAKI